MNALVDASVQAQRRAARIRSRAAHPRRSRPHAARDPSRGRRWSSGGSRDNDCRSGATTTTCGSCSRRRPGTASSTRCASARSSQGDDDDLDRFDRFGFLLGVGFQITDDVLNLVGSRSYGKEIDGDLWEGKRTLPLLYAFPGTRGRAGHADGLRRAATRTQAAAPSCRHPAHTSGKRRVRKNPAGRPNAGRCRPAAGGRGLRRRAGGTGPGVRALVGYVRRRPQGLGGC